MAIAFPKISCSAGTDEKAAVVALALDDIAAKVSAQLDKKLETASVEVPAKAIAPLETTLKINELIAEPSAESVVDPVVTPPTASEFADVRQLAAEGHFQAIAYWLNELLVIQNVYAQVLADDVPGRLKVLVEFEKPPRPKRLVRFVCDRLYRLNSDVIEGVHIIARPLGAAKTDWEKLIRIPTLSERKKKQAQQQAERTKQAEKRQKASTIKRVYHSSTHDESDRVIAGQFKFLRAALMCGSAITALFFGCFTTLLLADSPVFSSAHPKASPAPWYGDIAEPDFSKVTEVSFRPASRFHGRTVEAALETVAVIPHNKVADPADPTVTLMFGGELALNDFIFEQPGDIDQLFSEIDIYQRADVSMVGLAEPLANASTSLQEDFYKRTRPQAAHALDAGGIDIVNLAGEGSMTYGARGLAETLNNLDRQGIYRVGAGRNQREAHRPEILEVKGQRVAYLGYNPEALKGAKAEKAGVALTSYKNRQHIAEDIRAIRSQVDWVVVNYRWGDTLEPAEPAAAVDTMADDEPPTPLMASVPEDWQKSLAREAVDAGADLVVGYHPQHIQGAEIYRDRPIAYSLGDFTFSSNPLKDHDTAALKVSLRNQQMKVEFLPVTIRDSKLQKATGEHGASILHAIRNASKTLDQPMQFPTVLKAEPVYLPEISEPAYEESAPPIYPSEPLRPPMPLAPAPDPTMQESEALFMPEADDIPSEAQMLDGYLLDEAPDETLDETINSQMDVFVEDVMSWEDPFAEDLVEEDLIEEAFQEPSNVIETYAEPMVGPLSAKPLNF